MTSSPMLIVLAVTPMAIYFYLLGIFHMSRRPVLISGTLDHVLLAVALSCFLAFGPIGHALLSRTWGPNRLIDHASLAMALLALAILLGYRCSQRVVIYHIRTERLRGLLEDLLRGAGLNCQKTLDGFEDPQNHRGIRIHAHHRMTAVVLETYGQAAKEFAVQIGRRLRQRLRAEPPTYSVWSYVFFLSSTLTMIVPLAWYIVTEPKAREAIRTLVG